MVIFANNDGNHYDHDDHDVVNDSEKFNESL